jgi:hypothetical protein
MSQTLRYFLTPDQIATLVQWLQEAKEEFEALDQERSGDPK